MVQSWDDWWCYRLMHSQLIWVKYYHLTYSSCNWIYSVMGSHNGDTIIFVWHEFSRFSDLQQFHWLHTHKALLHAKSIKSAKFKFNRIEKIEKSSWKMPRAKPVRLVIYDSKQTLLNWSKQMLLFLYNCQRRVQTIGGPLTVWIRACHKYPYDISLHTIVMMMKKKRRRLYSFRKFLIEWL